MTPTLAHDTDAVRDEAAERQRKNDRLARAVYVLLGLFSAVVIAVTVGAVAVVTSEGRIAELERTIYGKGQVRNDIECSLLRNTVQTSEITAHEVYLRCAPASPMPSATAVPTTAPKRSTPTHTAKPSPATSPALTPSATPAKSHNASATVAPRVTSSVPHGAPRTATHRARASHHATRGPVRQSHTPARVRTPQAPPVITIPGMYLPLPPLHTSTPPLHQTGGH